MLPRPAAGASGSGEGLGPGPIDTSAQGRAREEHVQVWPRPAALIASKRRAADVVGSDPRANPFFGWSR